MTGTPEEITNDADYISMYDVRERVAYLTKWMREADNQEVLDPDLITDEERTERDALLALIDEVDRAASDAENGTLVRGTYFTEYAKEFASDIHGVNATDWPLSHVPWDEAADSLKVDFRAVAFGNVVYYVR